jgi:hypothetical protein
MTCQLTLTTAAVYLRHCINNYLIRLKATRIIKMLEQMQASSNNEKVLKILQSLFLLSNNCVVVLNAKYIHFTFKYQCRYCHFLSHKNWPIFLC